MDGSATEHPSPDVDTRCFRHPRQEARVRCVRCERHICPICMRTASVGHHCPECVRAGSRTIRQARTVFGGRVGSAALATHVAIALNVMVYLVELAQPMTVGRFSNLGSALIGEDGRYYVDDGGSYPGYHLIGVAHGEWYRLITSSFLHALPGDGFFGVTHLIFNMFWLWLLGRILEKDLGHLRFLVVYLLAALGGSVMEFLVDPHAPALGASGAVYGLAACYFLVTRRLH